MELTESSHGEPNVSRNNMLIKLKQARDVEYINISSGVRLFNINLLQTESKTLQPWNCWTLNFLFILLKQQ